jgi:hypothetical protein
MGFIKKLIGGDSTPKKQTTAIQSDEQQFDIEWHEAVHRFGIVAGFESFSFELRHPEANQVMAPHKGLAGTFEEWKQIRSPWDRRALLFNLLLNTVANDMKPWQRANILVANRYPVEALALLDTVANPEAGTKDHPSVCAAFAQALLGAHRFTEAIPWAKSAHEEAPQNRYFKSLFADALFLSGDCDKANEFYSELMAAGQNQPKATSGTEIENMFVEMFARETGAVPSPVFAIQIGKRLATPSQVAEFWNLAEAEFYDSPYFRMQHAYHLVNQGEAMKAIAKLAVLVQEMPLLREASLNLALIFERFDPDGKLMAEFQAELKERIRANGWTTEGMHRISIGNG